MYAHVIIVPCTHTSLQLPPKGISIGSAVFAGVSIVTNTDTQT